MSLFHASTCFELMFPWRGYSEAQVYERPYFTKLARAKDFTVTSETNFDILLTVHLNVFILILTNLMH